ncbi:MAG: hypothetical protein HYS08_07080 [Chlamydiae bacterium]|nr:hypothetical protein [Chlamydiota bacterium]MBI3266425.1 hypothetical protein [Chlamydiota bacterium]
MLKLISFLFFFFLSLFSFAQDEGQKVLVLNDFDRGFRFNLLKGLQGGDGEEPGLCMPGMGYEKEGDSGLTGENLKLSYNVKAGGSYSFFWMKLGPFLKGMEGPTRALDLSDYHYLSFWVKGEEGKERFKIEIHQDSDGDGIYVAGKDISGFVYVDAYLIHGVGKHWSKVTIALSDFRRVTDWKNILELVFTFENFANVHKMGAIYVDDLVFGTFQGVEKDPPGDFPFALMRDSLKVEGSLLKEGSELSSLKEGSLSLSGHLPSFESLRWMISYDGVSWQTLGKAFSSGDLEVTTSLDDSRIDRTRSFMLSVLAFDAKGHLVSLEKPIKDLKLKEKNDEQFLDELEKKTFQYFWDHASRETGLILDASHNDFASIAATGFGISAYCVGVERGWVPKEEAQGRVEKLLDTLLNRAESKSGFFYHFLDMNDASRFGGCEISVVDTAILMWGLLTAEEYFGGKIQEKVEKIYEKIAWQDFLVKDPQDIHYNIFKMGWLPEGGPEGQFLDAYWDYYSDEAILISLLALGSSTHSVEPEVFYAWKREKASYPEGGSSFVQAWSGGLFAYQYAHDWIDFRNRVDRAGVDWWKNSVDATVANRQYCIDQMGKFKSYSPYSWGVTSMACPNVNEIGGWTQVSEDYTMNYGTLPCGTGFPLQDGTVGPSGPAGSLAFLPEQVIPTLRHMVMEHPEVWGEYGFRSSYNVDLNWFSTSYYGIDLGASLLAIENHRSGLVWKLIMKNPHVVAALKKAGFKERT